MKKKTSSFAKELKKLTEPTEIINMEPHLKKDPLKTQPVQDSEEYVKLLQSQQQKRKQYFPIPTKDQIAQYKKIQDMRTPPIDMSQEKNIHSIAELKKQDPAMESILAKLEKAELARVKGLTKENLPKVPEILEKTPKKLSKSKGKFGILSSLLGLGVATLAPQSKAAELVQKVGEAAAEQDPGTHLQRMLDDSSAKLETLREQNTAAKMKPDISNEAISNVEGLLRGDQDISSALGERETPDIEDGDRLYAYEAERRKRQLGYK